MVKEVKLKYSNIFEDMTDKVGLIYPTGLQAVNFNGLLEVLEIH